MKSSVQIERKAWQEMKQTYKITRVLQVLCVILAGLMVIGIFPLNLMKQKVIKKVETNQYQETGMAMEEVSVMQEIIPSAEYLRTITVMVDSLGGSMGFFRFHLYDQQLNLLWQDAKRFDETPGVANYTFHVNQEVTKGQPYYYTLDFDCADFVACYTDKQDLNGTDNGILYYDLKEIPGGELITRYEYETALSVKRILCYDAVILLFAAMCVLGLYLLERYLKRAEKEIRISIAGVLKLFCSLILFFFYLYSMYQIGIQKIFNEYTLDNTILMIGTTLLFFVILYAVKQMRLDKVQNICTKESLISYLQAFFFGMAVLACCDFVNAGSNYAQGLGLYQMCIFLGLAVLTMVPIKELCKIWNGIYVVLATLVIVFYCKTLWGQGEAFQTGIRFSIMWGIAGLVLFTAITNFFYRKRKWFDVKYAAMTGLFFLLILVFRNGNSWPIAVVVPFSIFYMRYANAKDQNQILNNISNGILFSFLVTTIQAFIYRPFHYYTMIRYSGMFMTVTVTAVYLTMIFAVAFCKLLVNYKKSPKLKSIYKELFLLGLACGYEFLTLSRTGIMSCAGVFLVILIIYGIMNRKEVKKLMPLVFMVILAIACCIPIAFSMSRMIPALTNRPKIYVGEEFGDTIRVGEPVSSFRYITVGKFLGLSTERILGRNDLNHMTQSGKTIEEALEEAKQIEDSESNPLEDSGIVMNEDKLTYVDEYGSVYTIDNPDYSNGRVDTFKMYLKNLNFTGHATIGLTREDGVLLVHAHNSFIQMAYDCGILTGIVFLLLYIVLGLRSLWYYDKRKEKETYAMLPLILFAAFGISSIVEHVLRPTYPLGFAFLLMIAPLIVPVQECIHDEKKKKEAAKLEHKSK